LFGNVAPHGRRGRRRRSGRGIALGQGMRHAAA
jgi:hypothetical protein